MTVTNGSFSYTDYLKMPSMVRDDILIWREAIALAQKEK